MSMPSSPMATPFHLLAVAIIIVLTVSSVAVRNHHNHTNDHHTISILTGNQTSCPLFVGTWVRDNTYPLYQFSSCPIIDPQFNCQMYGRPDTDYLKYRWQPSDCQIPRFNAAEFLTRMRGKSVMFVGDSLGRNQWQSLICMISAGVPAPTPTQISKGDPLSTVDFLEYGARVSFYRAPYLVDIESVQGKRVLRLGDIRENAKVWIGVDLLLFNTGHWWTHTGSLQGWDYMDMDGNLYTDMDRLVAMERGLRTWAKWVDTNVDITKTRVFFQGFSPTHYNPSEWSGGTVTTSKSCYGETVPMTGMTSYHSDQMRVLQGVLSSMKSHPFLLDITMLSAMRKDAHPSIYNGDLTPGQRANPDHSADCSHWCLPGLPDTWNQLFYTALLYSY